MQNSEQKLSYSFFPSKLIWNKNFFFSLQNAAQKLRQLEDKLNIGQKSEAKDHEESPTTNIPLPDWADKNKQAEREKERSRTSSEGVEDKSRHDEFRHGAQVCFFFIIIIMKFFKDAH